MIKTVDIENRRIKVSIEDPATVIIELREFRMPPYGNSTYILYRVENNRVAKYYCCDGWATGRCGGVMYGCAKEYDVAIPTDMFNELKNTLVNAINADDERFVNTTRDVVKRIEDLVADRKKSVEQLFAYL